MGLRIGPRACEVIRKIGAPPPPHPPILAFRLDLARLNPRVKPGGLERLLEPLSERTPEIRQRGRSSVDKARPPVNVSKSLLVEVNYKQNFTESLKTT